MTKNTANQPSESQILRHKKEKAQFLTDAGIPLYPNDFRKKHEIRDLIDQYTETDVEILESMEEKYALAARIVAHRSFGKVTFFHIQDDSGRIQVYAQRDLLGVEEYKLFKKYEVGDIVGVQGGLFKTKTGELTIKAESVRLLSKSLRPLPEKYHGLKDVETRYRQRYVDLLVNPRAKEIFAKRTAIVQYIRNFLNERSFMEVETPMMQAIAGGATARPFETHHNALDMKLFLRIAPELYLKRLLVGGFERVYEINRNFRNEGIDTTHNPEFTMLEFYWAFATFEDLMDLTEELFSGLATAVNGTTEVEYDGNLINLGSPWARVTFHDSLEKIGNVPPEVYRDYEAAKNLTKKLGENVDDGEKIGKIQAKIFDNLVEPKLIQPHFIYHYPTDISPLSRRNEEDPSITDRFELFISGQEMANAFSELNDPVDQKGRFEEQIKEKEAGDDEAHAMDEDYVRALEYGMPPAAGQGIGIDRLVMLLTDSPSIREVILFPLLRPETAGKE